MQGNRNVLQSPSGPYQNQTIHFKIKLLLVNYARDLSMCNQSPEQLVSPLQLPSFPVRHHSTVGKTLVCAGHQYKSFITCQSSYRDNLWSKCSWCNKGLCSGVYTLQLSVTSMSQGTFFLLQQLINETHCTYILLLIHLYLKKHISNNNNIMVETLTKYFTSIFSTIVRQICIFFLHVFFF